VHASEHTNAVDVGELESMNRLDGRPTLRHSMIIDAGLDTGAMPGLSRDELLRLCVEIGQSVSGLAPSWINRPRNAGGTWPAGPVALVNVHADSIKQRSMRALARR
jgi:hypothetical protein